MNAIAFRRMAALAAAVLLVVPGGDAAAQNAERVETSAALARIVRRVDPIVPPEAAAANAGGAVIADATIGPGGTVTGLTILSGHPLLRPSAERALRQWTFKPFVAGGRARAVRVILEVTFPDAARDAERRVYDTYRSAAYACQRQLQMDPVNAEAPCADAVRAADALPADRVLERSHAIADQGQAQFRASHVRDAADTFERALAVRRTAVNGPDADNADLLQILANLHITLGELARADAEFTAAIETYDGALQRLPSMRALVVPRLRSTLTAYAALKRAQGDTNAVTALEARAAALADGAGSAARPLSPPKTVRTHEQLRVVEPPDARLSASDLNEIAAVLKRAGRAAWMLDARRVSSAAHERSWFVAVYEQPEVGSATLRRGRVGFVSCGEASDAGCPGWTYAPTVLSYAQVGAPDTDAASAPPIDLQPAPNAAPPSDAEVLGVVAWLRGHAVRTPTDRLFVDIQPWPPERIIGWGTDSLSVTLADPEHASRTQTLHLRRTGGEWTLVDMR